MLATQRQFDASVIQRLLDEPYRFEFFQAVRVIEVWLRQNGVPHDRVLADYLRFQNSSSLGFPASQIEALAPQADTAVDTAAALLDALRANQLRYISIRPAFMGMLGVNGALPLHYSERIAGHEFAHKDEGPRAFFDLFSNRSLAFFYQAWAKYRLEYRLDDEGRDGFLPLLLAFAGIEPRSDAWPGAECEPAGGDIADETMARFAAQIRARSVSASVMAGVLSEYFDVPIGVEQFVGGWDVLSAGQQARLGQRNCRLGEGATLGERIWRHDLTLRIRVGPLARKQYERFLPGAGGALALEKMLRMFVTGASQCEVQLVLRAAEVHGVSLLPDAGARLGVDAFLATAAATRDRGDLCYRLQI